MARLSLSALVVLTLLFAACSESPTAHDSTPPPTPGLMITALPDGYERPATQEARLDAFEARSAFRVALREIMGDAEGWRDADARTRALLRDTPDVPAYAKEQTAATSMLTTFLLHGDQPEPAQVEAIGAYTEMLVRHGNPDADLVDQALAALDGSWSDTQISQSAEAAYAATEAYVRAQADCEDCRIADVTTARAGDRIPELTGALQRVVNGAERLEQRF